MEASVSGSSVRPTLILLRLDPSSSPHRCALFGDEGQVVLHVPHGLENQLPQGDEAGFAVDGGTLPDLRRLQAQDACRMTTKGNEQGELFSEIESLVVQPLGVGSLINAHQQRAVQGNRSLDAV